MLEGIVCTIFSVLLAHKDLFLPREKAKPTPRLGIRMVDETEIFGSQADTRDSFSCEK